MVPGGDPLAFFYGGIKFANKRAEGWWRMREELNPDQPFGSAIALPPDASITTDLAAPRWELIARGIKIENRKRLGRSPDDGEAIVMCLSEGARAALKQACSTEAGMGATTRASAVEAFAQDLDLRLACALDQKIGGEFRRVPRGARRWPSKRSFNQHGSSGPIPCSAYKIPCSAQKIPCSCE